MNKTGQQLKKRHIQDEDKMTYKHTGKQSLEQGAAGVSVVCVMC